VKETVNILDVTKIINNKVEPYNGLKPYLSTGDLNINKINNLEYVSFEDKPSRANLEVKENDVIFARMQDTKKVKIIKKDEENFIVSTGFCVLRPSKFIYPKYLYYYLLSDNFQYIKDKYAIGATQKAINNYGISKIKIPLPTLTEQKKIVKILELAEEIKDLRKQANENADKVLPSIFYKMFGNPDSSKEKIKISDFILSVEKRNPSENPNSEFLYIDISGVNGETGSIENIRKLKGFEAPSRARQIIRKNDVIISTVRPYLKATALIPNHLDNHICSTGFCVLRAKNKHGYGYLYALSRLEWFTNKLNQISKGASYPAVTDNDIKNILISKPSYENIKIFDILVDNILEIKNIYYSVTEHIDKMLNILFSSAFSGSLTKKWREEHLEKLLQEIEEQKKYINTIKNV